GDCRAAYYGWGSGRAAHGRPDCLQTTAPGRSEQNRCRRPFPATDLAGRRSVKACSRLAPSLPEPAQASAPSPLQGSGADRDLDEALLWHRQGHGPLPYKRPVGHESRPGIPVGRRTGPAPTKLSDPYTLSTPEPLRGESWSEGRIQYGYI